MKPDVIKMERWSPPEWGDDQTTILSMPNVPAPMFGCFREDTEALTSKGWKRISEVTTEDLVATWDMDTEKVIWDYPYQTIKLYSKQLVRIKQKSYKTFATLVTPDHRIPVRAKLDPRRQCNKVRANDPDKNLWHLMDTTAAKLNMNSYKHFITAARNGTNISNELTDAERIYIAVQADGNMRHTKMVSNRHNKRYVGTKGLFSYNIRVKKDRKKKRIEYLLQSSGLKYTKQQHGEASLATERGYQRYDVWTPYDCKNFWNCFDITQFSQQKAQQFIDEISLWDGSCEETCGILNRKYYTTVEENVKFAQAVAVIAGVTSSLVITPGDKEKDHHDSYTLVFLDRDFRTVQSCTKEVIEHDDYVYCINVPTSYFVVRDGESKSVMITGNCAPRTVLGAKAWERMRKQCYAEAGYKCEVCGYDVSAPYEKQAHELYEFDYENRKMIFKRVVCLCRRHHINPGVHTGRAITMFKQHNVLMPKEKLLEGTEDIMRMTYEYNKEHPDNPMRLFATYLDFLKVSAIADEVQTLIEKYGIKFYKPSKDPESEKHWGEWRLVIGGEEYLPKYASYEEFEESKPQRVGRPETEEEAKLRKQFDALLNAKVIN